MTHRIGQANTDPNGGGILNPVLSIEGDADGFNLCQTGNLNVVVFQPTPTSLNYDFDSCYEVAIVILQAE